MTEICKRASRKREGQDVAESATILEQRTEAQSEGPLSDSAAMHKDKTCPKHTLQGRPSVHQFRNIHPAHPEILSHPVSSKRAHQRTRGFVPAQRITFPQRNAFGKNRCIWRFFADSVVTERLQGRTSDMRRHSRFISVTVGGCGHHAGERGTNARKRNFPFRSFAAIR